MAGKPQQAECELDVGLELEAVDANGATGHEAQDRCREPAHGRRDRVEEAHGAPMPPIAPRAQARATCLESRGWCRHAVVRYTRPP